MSLNKINILFRTSGGVAPNKELGFGHVYRCINLAKKISNNKIFFEIEDYGQVKKLLNKNNFKNIFNLKKNIKLNAEIKETIKIVKNNSIDIVIVDKYKIDKKILKEISRIVKTVYIADLKERKFPVDLVINGFVGYDNQISYNKSKTKCLLGPKYQILDKRFEVQKTKKKKYDLLITFGGYDENNIIELFLECWDKIERKIKILIILGPGTKRTQQIKKMLKKYPKEITIMNQTSKMFENIAETRFGLCAGGLTTYEFARMNIPFAIICQNKHQLITAKEWEKRKIARNLGTINKNTSKKINGYLTSIIENKIKLTINKTYSINSESKTLVNEIRKLVNVKSIN
jgi:UDP-2,4-diacetamido-2,4,6-trideoxy-beta-L-altropyranose hydrolase